MPRQQGQAGPSSGAPAKEPKPRVPLTSRRQPSVSQSGSTSARTRNLPEPDGLADKLDSLALDNTRPTAGERDRRPTKASAPAASTIRSTSTTSSSRQRNPSSSTPASTARPSTRSNTAPSTSATTARSSARSSTAPATPQQAMEQINSLLPALASAKGLPEALPKCRTALWFLRNADLPVERRLAVERAACVAVGRAREGNMVRFLGVNSETFSLTTVHQITDALSELTSMHSSICLLCDTSSETDHALLVPLPADFKVDPSIVTLVLQYQLQLVGCLLSSSNAISQLDDLVAALDSERGSPATWRRWIEAVSLNSSSPSSEPLDPPVSATQRKELVEKADSLLRMTFSIITRSLADLESNTSAPSAKILRARRAALFLLLETKAFTQEDDKLGAWWDQAGRFLHAFVKPSTSQRSEADGERRTVRAFADSLFRRGRCEGKEWIRFTESVISWANRVRYCCFLTTVNMI
jgi:hypothetical protein